MVVPKPSALPHPTVSRWPPSAKNGIPRNPSRLRQEIRAGDIGPSLGTDLASEQKKTRRRKHRSIWRRCKLFAMRHTWTIPLVPLLTLISLYLVNPTESNVISRFIFLSYKQPALEAGLPPQYGKGIWDIAFVLFYIIVLSFTRELIMQEILRPLARLGGIKSRGKQLRFMEQMYTAVYFFIIGPAGLYVMRQTPVWYFNTRGMYENFPHRTHDACFKFYYLLQAAYWAQQALVMILGLEKPRKDYNELVAHHIITLVLIGLSYRFHFTYMGIAVYITHDISDLLLAISKSLNYVDSPMAPLSLPGCIGVWIYTRHYLNLRIILSLLTEFRTVGPYELNWEEEQYKGWLSNIITLGLMTALQALNMFWLFCLLRVVYKYLVHKVAKDDRSEVEESELEDEQKVEAGKEAQPLPSPRSNDLTINGSANGVTKATGNGTASPTAKRRSGR